MSKSAIVPKSSLTVSRSSCCVHEEPSHCAERNLALCARRRYQFSQVACKCQRRTPYCRPTARSPFKLPTPHGLSNNDLLTSSTLPATCNLRIGTSRKSLSMINLTSSLNPNNLDTLMVDKSDSLSNGDEIGKEMTGSSGGISARIWLDGLSQESDCSASESNQSQERAANLVCRMLMLNAWRRRRADIAWLNDSVANLTRQLEHSQIQIVVLRRLLDTEHARLAKLGAESHRAKGNLEEASRERDSLKTQVRELEEQLRNANQVSEERSVAIENLRNDLLTSQNQLRSLDGQIARDREKLLKLREDKKLLLEKISTSEALAAERGKKAERAENAVEELQTRLAAQIALVESSQEQTQRYFRELKAKEEYKITLSSRLKQKEEEAGFMSLKTIALENKLAEREDALRRIESAFNCQTLELNELRNRLTRQSQDRGWSSRMLEIAGSVVRAPRAILRTLSFLSSTNVQLTSS